MGTFERHQWSAIYSGFAVDETSKEISRKTRPKRERAYNGTDTRGDSIGRSQNKVCLMRDLRYLNAYFSTFNLHVRAIALAHDFASRSSYLPCDFTWEPDERVV